MQVNWLDDEIRRMDDRAQPEPTTLGEILFVLFVGIPGMIVGGIATLLTFAAPFVAVGFLAYLLFKIALHTGAL